MDVRTDDSLSYVSMFLLLFFVISTHRSADLVRFSAGESNFIISFCCRFLEHIDRKKRSTFSLLATSFISIDERVEREQETLLPRGPIFLHNTEIGLCIVHVSAIFK